MFQQLKVVELASVLAGPSVGMFLAELGAEVIKIENLHAGGDMTRQWKLALENKEEKASAYYHSVNWGKQTIFKNFNSEADLQFTKELIKKADIVIANFKKGKDIQYGLDFESLSKENPELIYASINGYGEESSRSAFDVVLQAETGFMSINGTSESGPLKMPVALIDVLAAHQLKEGILVALLKRGKNKIGSRVSVSLYDTGVSSLTNQASNWLNANHNPQRLGSIHPNIAPYGETFETADNKQIVLAIGTDKQFHLLCEILGAPELSASDLYKTNPTRVTNRVKLSMELDVYFSKVKASYIMQDFIKHDVPAGIITDVKEVFESEANGKLILKDEVDGKTALRVKTKVFEDALFKSDKFDIIVPDTKEEFEKYYQLRYEVLRKPWNQPLGSEKDITDSDSFHLMAIDKNHNCIGTCRMSASPEIGTAQLRFMAIDPSWQGKGVGKKLIELSEKWALCYGFEKIMLQARDTAVPFYKSSGFKIKEKTFLMWNEIQHFEMLKGLNVEKNNSR